MGRQSITEKIQSLMVEWDRVERSFYKGLLNKEEHLKRKYFIKGELNILKMLLKEEQPKMCEVVA